MSTRIRSCTLWSATAVVLSGCATESMAGSDESSGTGGIVSASGANEDAPDGGETQTGDSSSDEEGLNCGESQFQLDAAPTRVMLVLDKSGSMVNFTWDHDSDPDTEEVTRWSSLHATVDIVTGAFDANIEFGAVLYPSMEATSTYDENACIVNAEPEVAVGPMQAQAVIDGIPAADEVDGIKGGTPATAGIGVALEHLRSFESSYPRAILFITDGEANCKADPASVTDLFEDYDEGVHALVTSALADDGIPTYVVGIAIRNEVLPDSVDGAPDGINPHEKLDELAVEGGRPREGEGAKYYATDNQLELEAALAEIVGETFNCVVTLEPEPENPQFVEIEIAGETVPRIDDCATESGWTYVNPDGPYDELVLCGDACGLLAETGTLEAIYGCPPSG